MGNLLYILTTFLRVVEMDPARLLPFLAYASAITLVIAVVTDAAFRREPARQKSPVEKGDAIPR